MGKLKLDFVTPERLLYSKDVEQVIVPGSEGEFTILSDHSPIISSLKPGYIKIYEDLSCLLYTSPSPRDVEESRMPSSA